MTTTVAPTSVPCGSCQGGDLRGLERTRFFARQIVTPDDLTQDQIYFREKARRHNRMLHGWGVVCGACVRRGATPCEVIIEPGYILGPFGDEIVIDRDTVVDVCKLGTGEMDGCCGDDLDPWCSDVRADCTAGTYYLAVKYSECMARPVRGGGGCGCGCDDHDCEYSRIRDGFSVKLLRSLPQGYTTPMKPPPFSVVDPCARKQTARACPPCPTDPWVIVADVILDAQCQVRGVNCFTHRRYVMSFADFFYACAPATAPGAGSGIRPGIAAPLAPGVTNTMRMMRLMSGSMDLVDTAGAMTGEPPRAMVALTRPDGSTAMLPAFFSVERGSTVADLLEREGDRTYYDPATERTYTLREIYSAAGVRGSTRLDGAAAALAPLEGKPLTAAGTPVRGEEEEREGTTRPREGAERTAPEAREPARALARERLRDTIDPSALERLRASDEITDLPATSIAGVSARSALGKRLADLTIGHLGSMTLEEFVEHATRDVAARRRDELARQAEEVWRRAQEATSAYAPQPDAEEEDVTDEPNE